MYLKTRTTTCQPGSNQHSFYVNGASPRSVISAVRDLKGSDDGLSDVLVLDPGQPVLSLGNVGAFGL